ncbi:hypothetical protein ANN_20721 [Periplaneta americana]|uniref:Uncharacterized protein n=1 Tax=Periplaneta americana TaxID=6978 RepID=A0ABQ8SE96_PERAM|nr:hypothetical protein ANN_20721 [Periplaneta americana]
MAGLCEGGNEPSGSLKAILHDDIRLLIPALYKNQSDSLMAADGACHHLCKLMAPVRHRWSINDVIGGIRNTVKSLLKGRWFASATHDLWEVTKDELQECFENWYGRWQKCITDQKVVLYKYWDKPFKARNTLEEFSLARNVLRERGEEPPPHTWRVLAITDHTSL